MAHTVTMRHPITNRVKDRLHARACELQEKIDPIHNYLMRLQLSPDDPRWRAVLRLKLA